MANHKGCAACAAHESCPVWDRAAFYETDEDAENLTHENEFEALADHLDRLDDPQLDELLDEGTIEITAYAREPAPDEAWFRRAARRMTDTFSDEWEDEFGGDESDPPMGDDKRGGFEIALQLLMRGALVGVEVYRCEPAATRVYDGERLYVLVRAEQDTRKADEDHLRGRPQSSQAEREAEES